MMFVASKRAKEHSKRSPESKVMAKTVQDFVQNSVLDEVGFGPEIPDFVRMAGFRPGISGFCPTARRVRVLTRF